MNNRFNQTIAERSGEVRLLVSAMRNTSEISWETIAQLLGKPLHAKMKWRHYVDSAKRILEREHSIVFQGVRGFGLRRLSDVGLVNDSGLKAHQNAKRSKRALKRLQKINFDNLTDEKKMEQVAWQAIHGVQAGILNATNIAKLKGIACARIANGVQKTLDVGSAVSISSKGVVEVKGE